MSSAQLPRNSSLRAISQQKRAPFGTTVRQQTTDLDDGSDDRSEVNVEHGLRRSERGECGGGAGEDAGNRTKAYHQWTDLDDGSDDRSEVNVEHGVRRSERGECGGAAGEDAGNRIKAYHQGVQATTDHTGSRDSGEGSMKGA